MYHNIIPVVATQLEGDRNKSRAALFVGTAIPFAMFTLWDGAVLGGVSAEDLAAGINLDPLSTLQGTSPAAAGLVKSFSVFAVSTSFLGFVLGLVDFLSDGFGWREEGDARPAPSREEHAVYLYQRGRFARPAIRLPCVAPAACVRFSPRLYRSCLLYTSPSPRD